MRLTDRDIRIVELVARTQALRDDQIQVALFSDGGASRCQRRLTLLVRHHYLDHLPRKAVNEPMVYVLGRKSVNGNRLLRDRWGDEEFARQRGKLGPLAHLLAVNDVRVRIESACADLSWTLARWDRPEVLAKLLKAEKLIPDAFVCIKRQVDGSEKTAAFFLELERVGKSQAVLQSKLARYADLYYRGRYQQIFGTRALRVLFVFASDKAETSDRRAREGAKLAAKLGVTIARFAALQEIRVQLTRGCLTVPIWYEPATQDQATLFSVGEEL